MKDRNGIKWEETHLLTGRCFCKQPRAGGDLSHVSVLQKAILSPTYSSEIGREQTTTPHSILGREDGAGRPLGNSFGHGPSLPDSLSPV